MKKSVLAFILLGSTASVYANSMKLMDHSMHTNMETMDSMKNMETMNNMKTMKSMESMKNMQDMGNMETMNSMDTSRIFLEGGLGLTSLKVKDKDGVKLKHKNLFEQNLGIGMDFNNKNLLTLKFTNLKSYKEKFNKDKDINLKIINLGLDYKHLFLNGYTIRPYINGSIGLTRGKTKVMSNHRVINKETSTRLSTGFGAGVQATLTNNFVVGVGAEYNYYASDVTGLNGKVFARYYF
ncbi:hypothetical protein A6A19_01045 [Actinobacillus delphinicola]|uniref:outer membrane beta-barrel protein n=1 Tax=Actinobacillus delphinicola TaxID=51161 RepID=UPI002441BA02|nr:outer membrane beta-barrel protein [Actinobacillus delphinicola]MDG6896615.1 hypothetical protein [Actinobacillus delphinicola]